MDGPFGSVNTTATQPELSESKKAGILGPIFNGDVVYLSVYGGVNQDRVPTLLGLSNQCTNPGDRLLIPIADAQSDTLDQASAYEIRATTTSNGTTYQFRNTQSGRSISVAVLGGVTFLTESVSPESFTLTQNTFSSWSNSENDIVALSFVNYTLATSTFENIDVCRGEECIAEECVSAGLNVPIGPVVLIPQKWLSGCNGNTGTAETDVKSGFCAATCAYADLAETESTFKFLGCDRSEKSCEGNCACAGTPILGFTNSSDCNNGFRYEYCKAPIRCEGTCQSGCSVANQVCIFEESSSSELFGRSNGTYTCVATGTTGTNGNPCFNDAECCPEGLAGCQQICVDRRCQTRTVPEKDRTLIIIGGSVLAALVLGIIIFVAYIYSDSSNSKK